MKILVVDDETVSRKKLQKIMSSFGECEEVDNGQAALEKFQKAWENSTPFDLITLDVAMPEMEGTEALQKIRKLEREQNLPLEKRVKIFMVTSHSDKDTVIASVKVGCDDYIVKPFNRETVLVKLKECGLVTTPS